MQLKLLSQEIYIATMPVDFRKSINGLTEVVINNLQAKPTDGIYVFFNRARNKIKILAWHRNGFALIYKCLDKGKFTLPASDDKYVCLDETQLSWLIAGLDWMTMGQFNEVEYTDFF